MFQFTLKQLFCWMLVLSACLALVLDIKRRGEQVLPLYDSVANHPPDVLIAAEFQMRVLFVEVAVLGVFLLSLVAYLAARLSRGSHTFF